MNFTLFIGIDVSKLTIDVALLDVNGHYQCSSQFSNTTSGFKKMLRWLKDFDNSQSYLFCLEHTGVYSLPICVFLEETNHLYSLQSGLQIKRSMGIQRGKNDKADAKVIAKYGFLNRGDISISKLPSKVILKLKNLVAYRDRLVKMKAAIKTAANELKAYSDKELHKFVCRDSSSHVKQLNVSISKIDKELQLAIDSSEELKRLFHLISSVKGIGLQIATNMLISTHGFTKFKSWRKFSCYCGLAPFEYSSGSSIRGKTRVSHLGNKRMKAMIGNGIASAIQNDPEIAQYYQRKLKEGKHKMVVLNAIKNKLISRAFAVVKRGTPFVNLYQHI